MINKILPTLLFCLISFSSVWAQGIHGRITDVLVYLLKERLEEIGISALIKDDFQSGINVGFVSGVPSAIDLYIQESDLKEAEPIVNPTTLD